MIVLCVLGASLTFKINKTWKLDRLLGSCNASGWTCRRKKSGDHFAATSVRCCTKSVKSHPFTREQIVLISSEIFIRTLHIEDLPPWPSLDNGAHVTNVSWCLNPCQLFGTGGDHSGCSPPVGAAYKIAFLSIVTSVKRHSSTGSCMYK